MVVHSLHSGQPLTDPGPHTVAKQQPSLITDASFGFINVRHPTHMLSYLPTRPFAVTHCHLCDLSSVCITQGCVGIPVMVSFAQCAFKVRARSAAMRPDSILATAHLCVLLLRRRRFTGLT